MSDADHLDRLRKRRADLEPLVDELTRVGINGTKEQRENLISYNQELSQIDAALLQAENTAALNRDADGRERERAAADDASFWFRRFMLSLQIGNGAGFLASLEGILHAEELSDAVTLAGLPAISFGLGVMLAGTLPIVLWGQRQAWIATNGVLRAFVGLALVVFTVGAATFFVLALGSIGGELLRHGLRLRSLL
jgi:hypothetical protein